MAKVCARAWCACTYVCIPKDIQINKASVGCGNPIRRFLDEYKNDLIIFHVETANDVFPHIMQFCFYAKHT